MEIPKKKMSERKERVSFLNFSADGGIIHLVEIWRFGISRQGSGINLQATRKDSSIPNPEVLTQDLFSPG